MGNPANPSANYWGLTYLGDATISYNDGAPTMSIATDGAGNSITLNCGENGVQLDETTPTNFHIVVPPTDARSFTLKINDTEGKIMAISTVDNAANQVERNMIITMPALDVVTMP